MSLHQFGHKKVLISIVKYDILDCNTWEVIEKNGTFEFIGIIDSEIAEYSLKTMPNYRVIINAIETQERYYKYPLTTYLKELRIYEVKEKRKTLKISILN